jgi:hypothetical protein
MYLSHLCGIEFWVAAVEWVMLNCRELSSVAVGLNLYNLYRIAVEFLGKHCVEFVQFFSPKHCIEFVQFV